MLELFLNFVCVLIGMEPSIRADLLQLTNEPNSTIYIRNNSLFLVPCEAAGEDPVKVYWRNESVMNSRAVLINTTTKGLWFMSGVQRSGSPKVHRVGTFRCMASNTAGVVMGKKFELNFICKYEICVTPSIMSRSRRVVMFTFCVALKSIYHSPSLFYYG